jgi:AraC-like DNA-binding protein
MPQLDPSTVSVLISALFIGIAQGVIVLLKSRGIELMPQVGGGISGRRQMPEPAPDLSSHELWAAIREMLSTAERTSQRLDDCLSSKHAIMASLEDLHRELAGHRAGPKPIMDRGARDKEIMRLAKAKNRPTQAEIARRVGCSPGTVRRVLNQTKELHHDKR